jgi:hypothetical protein
MLPDNERSRVLALFPPRYPDVKASHITLQADPDFHFGIPQDAAVVIVGEARHEGIEALICTVDGETHRPDGKVYHITLSHTDEFRPKHANAAIMQNGWSPLDEHVPIKTKGFTADSMGRYIVTPLSAKG